MAAELAFGLKPIPFVEGFREAEKLPSLNTWIRYLSRFGGEHGLSLLRRTVLGLKRLVTSLDQFHETKVYS